LKEREKRGLSKNDRDPYKEEIKIPPPHPHVRIKEKKLIIFPTQRIHIFSLANTVGPFTIGWVFSLFSTLQSTSPFIARQSAAALLRNRTDQEEAQERKEKDRT
jgi:hypothetical protein